MRGHGEKLTRKHEQAIAALFVSPTIGEAAQAVGISAATLWRWLQRAEFQRAYRTARQEVVAQAVARLQQMNGKAVGTLETIIDDADASAGARVSAAKALLELTTKSFALEDRRAQVAELEARLQEQDQGHARLSAAR